MIVGRELGLDLVRERYEIHFDLFEVNRVLSGRKSIPRTTALEVSNEADSVNLIESTGYGAGAVVVADHWAIDCV